MCAHGQAPALQDRGEAHQVPAPRPPHEEEAGRPPPPPPRTHAGRSTGPAARSPRSSRPRSWTRGRPPPGTGCCTRSWGTASRGSTRRRGRRWLGTAGRPPPSGRSGSRCSCTGGSPAGTGLSLRGGTGDREVRPHRLGVLHESPLPREQAGTPPAAQALRGGPGPPRSQHGSRHCGDHAWMETRPPGNAGPSRAAGRRARPADAAAQTSGPGPRVPPHALLLRRGNLMHVEPQRVTGEMRPDNASSDCALKACHARLGRQRRPSWE